MKRYLLAGAALLLGACAQLGPGALRTSRIDYNQALRRTEDEQLLLNLVRLRYRDRPLFLEATSLNTQFTFARAAGASGAFGADADRLLALEGGLAFEEKPTVTYTPLQGEAFVERVLARIPLETLFLLDGSGWSIERIFRTCLQSMNGLQNAARADGPTPAEAPEYRRFQRACQLLRDLELQGLVASARRGEDDLPVLRFEPRAGELDAYRELMQLLDLDPERRVFPVVSALERQGAGTIVVRPRSFVGLMYFLSQGVEPPAEDLAAGRVTLTRDEAGLPFDWAQVTAGLMRIRSSASRPEHPAVAVRFRGSWFYVDDADLDSKSTLSMLEQVFALQSGGARGQTPMLTIPVGG